MGFLVGLLFGLVASLAIVILFVRSETSRSNLRTKLVSPSLIYSLSFLFQFDFTFFILIFFLDCRQPRWLLSQEWQSKILERYCRQNSTLLGLCSLSARSWLGLISTSRRSGLTLTRSSFVYWMEQSFILFFNCLDLVLQAASDLIKASVEPVLEQYRPVILSSLKFSKFTLGTVAPQFTG